MEKNYPNSRSRSALSHQRRSDSDYNYSERRTHGISWFWDHTGVSDELGWEARKITIDHQGGRKPRGGGDRQICVGWVGMGCSRRTQNGILQDRGISLAAHEPFVPDTLPLNWPWITEEDRRRDHPITWTHSKSGLGSAQQKRSPGQRRRDPVECCRPIEKGCEGRTMFRVTGFISRKIDMGIWLKVKENL
ncbi:hypothetical protein B0H13DRAFT_1883413 [Mycena leptocephala]|nr:hypothetical protein B0H13DRAFT_1883413 [Mycena leptocephala]